MDSVSPLKLWMNRAMLAGLAVVILFVHLLPLQTVAGGIPAPDILALLIFAWVLRRPDYVPAVMIALIVLIFDMFFMRPPGLMAALTVAGAEVLRERGISFREMPFSFEWLLVAAVLVGIAAANQIILLIMAVDAPALAPVAIQLFLTILAYPLVVAFCRHVAGIRRLSRGGVDALGRRT